MDDSGQERASSGRRYLGHDVLVDTVWRCPCGYTGPFPQVISHRRGAPKRPDCAVGGIYQLWPMPEEGHAFRGPPNAYVEPYEPPDSPAPSPPVEPDTAHPTSPGHFEFTGFPEDVQDAEGAARWLNQLRAADPTIDLDVGEGFTFGSGGPLDGSGNGNGDMGGILPPGDWQINPPPRQAGVSETKDSIALPVIAKVFYDWARSQGWNQGDGSISAFVTDCLLDHFRHCWGKAVVVVDRGEVQVV